MSPMFSIGEAFGYWKKRFVSFVFISLLLSIFFGFVVGSWSFILTRDLANSFSTAAISGALFSVILFVFGGLGFSMGNTLR